MSERNRHRSKEMRRRTTMEISEWFAVSFGKCEHFSIGAFLLVLSLAPVPLAESQTAARVEATARFVSLRLVPERAKLQGAKASQRFLALAVGEDGIERDVTDLVTLR